MSWFILAWQRAADFSGRSRRKEYWYFQLFNSLIFFALAILSASFDWLFFGEGSKGGVLLFVIILYGIISFVPSLAITIRRLHDVGKSGWWYCIGFVPIVGSIILLVLTILDSEPFANQWGLDPKVAERAAAPPYPMYR
jgi:uncharacterized membrane protein YhaH (DUF805 family)